MVSAATPSPAVALRTATADDDEAVADLAYAYMQWAIPLVRSEFGIEWPAVTLESVRRGVEGYRSNGVVLLAEIASEAVGMGAVRRLDDGSAEIKRMYVGPGARGLGVGGLILDGLLDAAREMPAEIVRLDSARFMTDAHRLYLTRGFVECSPHAGSEVPPEIRHHWRFFERPIS